MNVFKKSWYDLVRAFVFTASVLIFMFSAAALYDSIDINEEYFPNIRTYAAMGGMLVAVAIYLWWRQDIEKAPAKKEE